MFQVNPLLGRGFTCKIKPYFLQKKSKKLKCCLLQFLFGGLRVKLASFVCKSDSGLVVYKPATKAGVKSSTSE